MTWPVDLEAQLLSDLQDVNTNVLYVHPSDILKQGSRCWIFPQSGAPGYLCVEVFSVSGYFLGGRRIQESCVYANPSHCYSDVLSQMQFNVMSGPVPGTSVSYTSPLRLPLRTVPASYPADGSVMPRHLDCDCTLSAGHETWCDKWEPY